MDVDEFRFPVDDGDTGLVVRRLDIRQQAPLEPGPQPVLQRLDLLGRPVGGEDDLLAALVQFVEGVEELLLGGLLPGDELHVVHRQHIGLAVLGMELLGGAVADGGDEFVGELLPLHRQDGEPGVVLFDLLADGVDQVGLAQPRPPVDKEGVVAVGGVAGHRPAGGVGELVAGTHDEGIEGVGVLPGLLLGRGRGGAAAVLGAHQPYLDIEPHHGGEGFPEEGKVLFLQDVFLELGSHIKTGHRTVKAFRFNVPDPKVIRYLGKMLLAIFAGQLEQVLKGIHIGRPRSSKSFAGVWQYT